MPFCDGFSMGDFVLGREDRRVAPEVPRIKLLMWN